MSWFFSLIHEKSCRLCPLGRCSITFMVVVLLGCMSALAQDAAVRGVVIDEVTGAPMPFRLRGHPRGCYRGVYRSRWKIRAGRGQARCGQPRLQLHWIPAGHPVGSGGYPVPAAFLTVEMSPLAVAIEAAEVEATVGKGEEEAPVSLRRIGTNEIKRNPGGGRDISKAIRSLPGWLPSPVFATMWSSGGCAQRKPLLHRRHRNPQHQSLCHPRCQWRSSRDDQCGPRGRGGVLFRCFSCDPRQCPFERHGVWFQDGPNRMSGHPMPWWERATSV